MSPEANEVDRVEKQAKMPFEVESYAEAMDTVDPSAALVRPVCPRSTAMGNLRIVMVGDRSRGRFTTPAQSLSRIVARAEGYTYAVEVWALSIRSRPIFLSPRADSLTFSSKHAL